jgi:hypothetical protein
MWNMCGWTRIQVFVNPTVVTPPHQHTHLLAGPGCYQEVTKDMQNVNKECDGVKGVHTLPPKFLPLVLTEQQDNDWDQLVKKHIIVEA